MVGQVNWGDVPSWFEAIGTTLAFGVAFYLIFRDKNATIRAPAEEFMPRIDIGGGTDQKPDELVFVAESGVTALAAIEFLAVMKVREEPETEGKVIGFRFILPGRWGPRQKYVYTIMPKCCSVWVHQGGACAWLFEDAKKREWYVEMGKEPVRVRRWRWGSTHERMVELRKIFCDLEDDQKFEPNYEVDGKITHLPRRPW